MKLSHRGRATAVCDNKLIETMVNLITVNRGSCVRWKGQNLSRGKPPLPPPMLQTNHGTTPLETHVRSIRRRQFCGTSRGRKIEFNLDLLSVSAILSYHGLVVSINGWSRIGWDVDIILSELVSHISCETTLSTYHHIFALRAWVRCFYSPTCSCFFDAFWCSEIACWWWSISRSSTHYPLVFCCPKDRL